MYEEIIHILSFETFKIMILQEDDIGQNKEKVNPNWIDIEVSLDSLDDKNKGFVILTDDTDSYIQCAGGQNSLVIEYRKYDSNDFEHYVIGYGELKSPMKSVWTRLNCKVGPITVLKDEVLSIKEAKEVFRRFFEQKGIPEEFNKRNVTKLHKK